MQEVISQILKNYIYSYETINLFKNGKKQFYVSKRQEMDDKFVGDGYLQPFKQQIDTLFNDNENFLKYLENASLPGLIGLEYAVYLHDYSYRIQR